MPTASLPEFRFSTDQLPPAQRFAVWREALSAMYEVTLPEGQDPEAFEASTVRWALGPVVVTEGHVTGHRMARTAQQALADGVDRYGLMLLLRGTWTGEFGGRPIVLGKGVPFLVDFSRPFDCSSTNNAFLMVHMSRAMLEDALPPGFDGHGMLLGGASGMLLSEHLAALVRHLPKLSPPEASHVGNATRDMIAACLVSAREADETPRPQVERALLLQAKRYIERHLHSRELTHDQICQALGISRSNLYRVFKPLGGVVVYIQRRRLACIHRLLSNPQEYRRMSELATQYGFVSIAHFSRAFRAEFGYSASEARVTGRQAEEPQEGTVAHDFRAWVRQHER